VAVSLNKTHLMALSLYAAHQTWSTEGTTSNSGIYTAMIMSSQLSLAPRAKCICHEIYYV